ncbi:MAG: hypothetical protein LKJ01_08490 [Lactobacillus sp.]|jgi:hypothetical protein|nr:hypothetical protein [Lactobacillus sp.]MCI2037186.1 hypothetical protein [Lactobacillus sp.]
MTKRELKIGDTVNVHFYCWGIFRSGNWFKAEDGTIKPSETTEASNAWRR